MLVIWHDYPVEKARIGMHLFGTIAADPENESIHMTASGGRRKAGRAKRYYVHGAPEFFSVTADSEEEAVEKANAKLAALRA